MARRADHTREELKELAIAQGLELIKKEGFSGFSARKLATRIGYTVGTLYNVFGSYDSMLLHINARTLSALFENMEATAAKARKGQALHALAQSYIAFSRSHYQQWLALFEYHVSKDYVMPDWYLSQLGRFFVLVEKPLLPLLHDNRRKAKRAARVLWAGIHGICVLALSRKLDLVEADSPEVLADSFIDNYIAGLTRE